MKKFVFLDSLRGLAALMVVADHFLYTFYPAVIAGPTAALPHGHILFKLFLGLPFGFMVNGAFAVVLFFVLSGFVLTVQFFETKDNKVLARQGFKRYLRLGVPILGTVLLGYVLMHLSLLYSPCLLYTSPSPRDS